MRILLTSTVLLVLACAIVGRPRRDERPPAATAARDPSIALLVLLALLALASSVAHVFLNRYLIFDDAFVAYRAAKHVGFGHGLVWNVGEPPQDRGASLLLVAFLAPFLHFRADPLLVTRVVSVLGALGIAGLVYLRRRALGSSREALLCGLAYCVSNLAFAVAMLGDATLLAAFAIYLAYHFATEYLDSRRLAALKLSGGALFVALLLEPSAWLLALLVSAVAAPGDAKAGRTKQHVLAIGATFWLPLALLFAWKWHYFGALTPSISGAGHGAGLFGESAFDFLEAMWKLVLLGALALPLAFAGARRHDRMLAASFVCGYAVLHLRADAQSDAYHHTFFPTAPLLFELALPALAALWAWLSRAEGRFVAEASMLAFIALGLAPQHAGASAVGRALRRQYAFAAYPSHDAPENAHARHLLEVGRALGEYPQVTRVTLAANDAAALVYASDVRHLALAGTEVFRRAPDMILEREELATLAGERGREHPNGRSSWVEDAGWDDFVYAGSLVDSESWRYERHLFIRKSAPAALAEFVRRRVVDYVLAAPPVRGSQRRERRERSTAAGVTLGSGSASRARLPLSIAPDRNYLVDASGAHFLLRGDAAWSSSHELDRAAFRVYLADRTRRGFNAFLLNVVDHTQGANGYPNAAHEAPFLVPGDFSTPNEPYFAYVDWLLHEAQNAGFVVFVCPAYLGYLGGDEGWYTNLLRNGPAKLREYGRFVARRWRELDNIVWMNAGDYTPPPEGMLLVNAVAAGIKDVDDRHLHTAHFGPETSGGDLAPDYLDIDTTYTYRPTYLKVARDHAADRGRRPLVLVESLYENEHQTRPQQIRAEAYHAYLNGASGNFYGSFPVWNFGKGWREALDSPGSRSMTHIFSLFEGLPWWTLEPEPPNVTLISGRGPFGSEDYASVARSTDGALVVAYVPSARELRIDLARLARPAAARWFDPTSGRSRTIAEGLLANDRIRTLTTPGPNDAGDSDWVLVLDARGDTR